MQIQEVKRLVRILNRIESANGKIPANEAVAMIAELDPDSSEARLVRYREKKGLPPL